MKNLMKIIARIKRAIQLKKENKEKEEQTEYKKQQKARKEKERIARIPETIAEMRRYPVIKLAPAEFEKMPKAGDFSVEWLENEAPFGFRFICKSFPECPEDLVIMGLIVQTEEIICEQYGSGMSPPKKFINRYRVIERI